MLGATGHAARLTAPRPTKPYVKRGKAGAAGAAALCEAARRPTMRHVPTRTADQQAALVLAASRERCVRGLATRSAGRQPRSGWLWPMPAAKAPDPRACRSGRGFAAWPGLTAKDHSTAGKARLGRITRAGGEALRSLPVAGAAAGAARRSASRRVALWLARLPAREPPKLAAVALANKMARGEACDITRAQPPTAAVA